MKTRWLRLGLVGLVAFVFSLLSRLPAEPVLTQLRNASSLDLRWQRVTGDIFDMTVHSVVLELPNGRRPVVDILSLQLSPLDLFRGRLSFSIQASAWMGNATTELSVGLQRWWLGDLQGQFPLAGLYPVLPELQLSGIDGEMLIRGDDLEGSYAGGPEEGQLEIDINDLVVALLAPGQPLGDYQIRLVATGDKVVDGQVNSASTEALLQLNTELSLDGKGNRLDVQGRGELAAAAPDALQDLLPLLGQVSGRKVEINWQQPLYPISP